MKIEIYFDQLDRETQDVIVHMQLDQGLYMEEEIRAEYDRMNRENVPLGEINFPILIRKR